MSDEVKLEDIEISDPVVKALLEELPNIQKYIAQERQQYIDQENLGDRVFGKVIEELLRYLDKSPIEEGT